MAVGALTWKPHRGSWGLPDFGITETIAGALGQNVNPVTGGSMLSGGGNYVNPSPYTPVTTSGQVQGTSSTGPVTTPQNQEYFGSYNTGGGGGGSSFNPKDPNANPGDQYFWDAADGWKQVGGGIEDALNQAYSSAFSDLDRQMSEAEASRGRQEEQVTNTYSTSAGRLGSEKTSALDAIDKQQKRSLEDLSDSLRQSWRQGNVMLGTRGASDSSAAKQYSYALTKLGNKQRGDLTQVYSDRRGLVQRTYENNLAELDTWKRNALLSIADWYSQQQSRINSARSELQGQKSQQLLNFAMQQIQTIQQQTANRQAVLQQWALNRAKSLDQALAALGVGTQNLPAFQGLTSGLQFGGVGAPSMFGFGQQDEQQANLFGV